MSEKTILDQNDFIKVNDLLFLYGERLLGLKIVSPGRDDIRGYYAHGIDRLILDFIVQNLHACKERDISNAKVAALQSRIRQAEFIMVTQAGLDHDPKYGVAEWRSDPEVAEALKGETK